MFNPDKVQGLGIIPKYTYMKLGAIKLIAHENIIDIGVKVTKL